MLLFAAENYRDIEKERLRKEDRGSKAAAILMQPVERVEGTAIVVGEGGRGGQPFDGLYYVETFFCLLLLPAYTAHQANKRLS